MLKQIIQKKLSVRQTEQLVRIFKSKKNLNKKSKDANLLELQSSISDKIGLSVSIKNKRNNSGSILFEYNNLEQLNRIIDVIKSNY